MIFEFFLSYQGYYLCLIQGDFIGGTPIVITPEGDAQNPNSSQFEHKEDAYTDVYG